MATGVIRWFHAVLLVGAVAGALGAVSSDSMDQFLGLGAAENAALTAILAAAVSGGERWGWGRPFDPTLDLDVPGLIRHWGYPCEEHFVTTEDGFVLGLHRITGGRQGSKRANGSKGPVLLAHPLLSSSAEWIVLGPEKALAFLLANAGYDVWLFNSRGNTYSRKHVSLDPKDAAFWDWSFHEHGYYDLPATINYTLRATAQRNLHYIGFSMGSMAMWVMGATRPEWTKPIKMIQAVGPVSTVAHSRSMALGLVFRSIGVVERIMRLANKYEFGPHMRWLSWLGEKLCSEGRITQDLCSKLMFSLSGTNYGQHNASMLPFFVARTPAGTSIKNMQHFAQAREGFRMYDLGHKANTHRYGQPTPPSYNVSLFTTPIRMYYGLNDMLSDWTDVLALRDQLSNVLSCEAVADPNWTHLDFVWARDAPTLVYDKILANLKEVDGEGEGGL